MNIDFTRNFFELFEIPLSFEIDQDRLSEKFRVLQSEFHPDRFANASDQERRIAVQMTAYINEAYSTLKSDLKRSHYLLKLSNIEFNPETETSTDAEFLMQQMDLHERVQEVDTISDPLEALDALFKEITQKQADLAKQFSLQYRDNNLSSAKDTALKLQFYNRLIHQLRKKQEKFEEELL